MDLIKVINLIDNKTFRLVYLSSDKGRLFSNKIFHVFVRSQATVLDPLKKKTKRYNVEKHV